MTAQPIFEALVAPGIGPVHLLGGHPQHGFIEPMFRVANGKLRGMHTNGQPAGPGGHVVATQRPLPPLVEPTLGGEQPIQLAGAA